MQETETRRWMPVSEFRREHPEVGGKNHVYGMIDKGVLKSIKLGGKILVASDALDLLADGLNNVGE